MAEGAWITLAAGVTQIGMIIGIWLTAREQRKTAKQLRPNGGSSVADAINRIEARVDLQSEDIGAIRSEVSHLNTRLSNHLDGR